MSDKEQVVLERMRKAEKPMRSGDVAKITGIDSKEVSKIINDLEKKGEDIIPHKMLLRAG